MASEIDELLELLGQMDLHTDVRHKGWECILGLTATDSGLESLLSDKFLSFLMSCVKDKTTDKLTLTLVYKCLINISSNKGGSLKLLTCKENYVLHLLNDVCNTSNDFIESICYIINNLSSHDAFWNEDTASTLSVDLLQTLTKLFLSNDVVLRKKYRFLALIFANITDHSSGRRLFLQNKEYVSDLFSICSIPSESIIRRLGVSLIMRNCCFETDSHNILLKELNILPNLLLPLMGPEEYKEEEMDLLPVECQYLESNKEREEHPKVRRTLVQALCLLCYTEEGWEFLKSKGVYYATRELHNWEKEESVVEAIETLIIYLLVENYTAPDSEGRQIIEASQTDIIKDLPDFVI